MNHKIDLSRDSCDRLVAYRPAVLNNLMVNFLSQLEGRQYFLCDAARSVAGNRKRRMVAS
jgi:hypothetical protein